MGNCLHSSHNTDFFAMKKNKRRIASDISIDNPRIWLEDFKTIKLIGNGTTSKVYLVEKLDSKKKYAMKVMKKSKQYRKDSVDIRGERIILEKIRHPFVVGLHYAFQQQLTLNLILELAKGGDLFNHIYKMKGLPEDHWRFYAAEIFCGLEFLHQNGIVYRNLKPEDVLLDKDGHIKLSDFGLARSKDEISSTFCGDPYYISPEIIKGEEQTYAVDWWSFGILIYEMIDAEAPFKGDSPKGILKSVLTKSISMPEKFSEEASDLIKRLLHPNPEERLGWDEDNIQEIKDHKFFESIDWEKIYLRKFPVPFTPEVSYDLEVWNVDQSGQNGISIDKQISFSKLHWSDGNMSNFYFNAHDCYGPEDQQQNI